MEARTEPDSAQSACATEPQVDAKAAARDGRLSYSDDQSTNASGARTARRGMCQFPGRHVTRALHAHHLVHWAHGGAAELANLILVCSFHHHLVHEGGGRIDVATRPFVAFAAGSPVDPHPTTARLRGDASVIERTLGPEWPSRGVGPLEPPNFGPFDLPWTTAILHHNEQIRRLEAQRS